MDPCTFTLNNQSCNGNDTFMGFNGADRCRIAFCFASMIEAFIEAWTTWGWMSDVTSNLFPRSSVPAFPKYFSKITPISPIQAGPRFPSPHR